MFLAACGFSAHNAELMREQLLDAAAQEEDLSTPSNSHGERYVVECELAGPTGRTRVRTAWIVRAGEDFPRFVSAYVM